ncbi:MAG: hypothetical protein ABIS86_09550 [Streptosporangiaceae bacterium]
MNHRDDGTRREFDDRTRRDLPPEATAQDFGQPYGNAALPDRTRQLPNEPDEHVRLRFGAGPAVPPAWNTPTPRRRRPKRSRVGPIISILVSAAIIGGVFFWLYLRGQGDLEITKITVSAPKGALACDPDTQSLVVPVVATLETNGKGGELRFQWVQSDNAAKLKPQSESVSAGGKKITEPLNWNVSGPGRTRLTATFKLISPVGEVTEAKAGFTYTCR